MKKLTYFVLLFLFPCIYSQEEFFGNQNGLSGSYLQGLNVNQTYGIGLSAYFKGGFLVGLGYQNVDNTASPLVTIAFYPYSENGLKFLKPVSGLSYSKVMDYHIWGISLGVYKDFFTTSNFPFALNSSFSLFVIHSREPYKDVIMNPTLGIGYIQTFFAKSTLYPFIGLSGAYENYYKSHLFSAMVGINVRLGSKPEKTKQKKIDKRNTLAKH